MKTVLRHRVLIYECHYFGVKCLELIQIQPSTIRYQGLIKLKHALELEEDTLFYARRLRRNSSSRRMNKPRFSLLTIRDSRENCKV